MPAVKKVAIHSRKWGYRDGEIVRVLIMTEENQNQSAEVEAQSAAPQVSEQKTEKLVPQEKVNDLIKGVKLSAYEKGRKEALAELERQHAANNQKQQASPVSDQITMTKEELEQIIDDRSQRNAEATRHQLKAQDVVNKFSGKMLDGMKKYEDFEELVGELNIPNMNPVLIDMVTAMDNTEDIMYEFAKNPGKYAQVLTLINDASPLAKKELKKLSSSIKNNSDAINESAKTQQASPLGTAKPSRAGVDSGAPKTVSDFRKQDWLRG